MRLKVLSNVIRVDTNDGFLRILILPRLHEKNLNYTRNYAITYGTRLFLVMYKHRSNRRKKNPPIFYLPWILAAEIGVSFSFVILDFPRRFKLLVFSFSFFFALSQSIFMSEKAAVFLS